MEPCSEAPDGGGHHWITKRTKETLGGQPLNELRCKYCDAKYAEVGPDA
jgi:hypothetical protein